MTKLSAKLEVRAGVADIAPLATYDDDTIRVLAPVGLRSYYLALDEKNSKQLAVLPEA